MTSPAIKINVAENLDHLGDDVKHVQNFYEQAIAYLLTNIKYSPKPDLKLTHAMLIGVFSASTRTL